MASLLFRLSLTVFAWWIPFYRLYGRVTKRFSIHCPLSPDLKVHFTISFTFFTMSNLFNFYWRRNKPHVWIMRNNSPDPPVIVKFFSNVNKIIKLKIHCLKYFSWETFLDLNLSKLQWCTFPEMGASSSIFPLYEIEVFTVNKTGLFLHSSSFFCANFSRSSMVAWNESVDPLW